MAGTDELSDEKNIEEWLKESCFRVTAASYSNNYVLGGDANRDGIYYLVLKAQRRRI